MLQVFKPTKTKTSIFLPTNNLTYYWSFFIIHQMMLEHNEIYFKTHLKSYLTFNQMFNIISNFYRKMEQDW